MNQITRLSYNDNLVFLRMTTELLGVLKKTTIDHNKRIDTKVEEVALQMHIDSIITTYNLMINMMDSMHNVVLTGIKADVQSSKKDAKIDEIENDESVILFKKLWSDARELLELQNTNLLKIDKYLNESLKSQLEDETDDNNTNYNGVPNINTNNSN